MVILASLYQTYTQHRLMQWKHKHEEVFVCVCAIYGLGDTFKFLRGVGRAFNSQNVFNLIV